MSRVLMKGVYARIIEPALPFPPVGTLPEVCRPEKGLHPAMPAPYLRLPASTSMRNNFPLFTSCPVNGILL